MARLAEGAGVSGRKAAIAAACLAAVGLFFLLDLQRFLTLDALKANRRLLQDYRAAHPLAAAAGFMAVYVATTALSLPGAAILSLAAGALFGPALGTLCACVAATAGATLAFLATRYALRDAVSRRFGGRLEGMNRELAARGFGYLLFLRLVPLFPFFLVNLAAGLTRLPLRTFVLATMIGIVPGGFVYVNAGASLAGIASVSDVASPRVLGSLALLGAFALVPALYGRFRKSRR
jgi:uncharacterized membrane protein YdjX (TVP38/TMEM64 family)